MTIEEIKSALEESGFEAKPLYGSNQEYVDNLIALQNGLAELVGQGDLPKNERIKAITHVVATWAEECGVADVPELKKFKHDMGSLAVNISSHIAGLVGEQRAFRSLRPIQYDRDTLVLHNVTLRDGDDATEVDAVVVTPYGVFVIEVKNCKGSMIITPTGFFQRETGYSYRYPLGERMGCKEVLVRRCIGEDLDVPVHTMLLFVNDHSSLKDEFGAIHVSYSNTVAYDIRAHKKDGRFLSSEQVAAISEAIEANRVEASYPSKTDLGAVVENFASLMRIMDDAKAKAAQAEAARDDAATQTISERFSSGLASILSMLFPRAA